MKTHVLRLVGIFILSWHYTMAQNSFLVLGGATSSGYRDGAVTPLSKEQSFVQLFLQQAGQVGFQSGGVQTPELTWSENSTATAPIPAFSPRSSSILLWPFFQIGQLGSRKLHLPESPVYQPFFRGLVTAEESSKSVLEIIDTRKFSHFIVEFGVQDYWEFISSTGRKKRMGGLETFALRYIQLLKLVSSRGKGMVANLPNLSDIPAAQSYAGLGFWNDYQNIVEFQAQQAGIPVVDVRNLFASITNGAYRTPQGNQVSPSQFFAQDQLNLSPLGHLILADLFIETWNRNHTPKFPRLNLDANLRP